MCLCWKSWTLTLFLDIDFDYNGILVWAGFRFKKGNTWVVFLTATCSFGFATFFIHCLRREWGLMEDTCHLVDPGLFFCSHSMCSHLSKAQRPVQAFLKAKPNLCTTDNFLVPHRFSLSCPASSCMTWPKDKGTRLWDRITFCVGRWYNQLRGHWEQM